MARINSCQKGKRVEREFRDLLRNAGYSSARRGRQYSGSPESPDVVCLELSNFHFEVKGVEQLNLWEAVQQASKDSAGCSLPVVAHKKKGKGWLITMPFEAWMSLVKVADLARLIAYPFVLKTRTGPRSDGFGF